MGWGRSGGFVIASCAAALTACSSETFVSKTTDAGGAPDVSTVTPVIDGGVDAAPVCVDVDFAFDGKNCGRCGRDCGGGQCVESKCSNVKLVGADDLVGLVLVGDDIFFTRYGGSGGDSGGVFRMPKTLGTATSVVSAPGTWDITAQGTTLAWTNWNGSDSGGGVYRKAASAKESLVASRGSPREIWSDAEGVYFVDDYEKGVSSIIGETNDVLSLGVEPTAFSVSTDKNYAYWVSTDAVVHAAPKRGGGEVKKVVDGDISGAMVDGGEIFVGFAQRASSGCNGGRVMRAALSGTAQLSGPLQLVGEAKCPTAFAVTATHMYFTETAASATVYRFTKPNGQPEVVVRDVESPSKLGADDRFLYWIDKKGLWRTALP